MLGTDVRQGQTSRVKEEAYGCCEGEQTSGWLAEEDGEDRKK